MYYLYVLQSREFNRFYIGSTKDLKSRFNFHNLGRVKSTQYYRPFILIYYEAYPSHSLARKREVELKNNNQQKEILFKRLNIIN